MLLIESNFKLQQLHSSVSNDSRDLFFDWVIALFFGGIALFFGGIALFFVVVVVEDCNLFACVSFESPFSATSRSFCESVS